MAGDTNRTERTAHSLKGEIGLLGATTAYSLAEELKTMGPGKPSGIARHTACTSLGASWSRSPRS
jgi:HPt (histidine-containing phosphotransfer) domain-containing protein